jgi:hypothetical protein
LGRGGVELTFGLKTHAPFFLCFGLLPFFKDPALVDQSDLLVLFSRNTQARKEKPGRTGALNGK